MAKDLRFDSHASSQDFSEKYVRQWPVEPCVEVINGPLFCMLLRLKLQLAMRKGMLETHCLRQPHIATTGHQVPRARVIGTTSFSSRRLFTLPHVAISRVLGQHMAGGVPDRAWTIPRSYLYKLSPLF